MRVPTLIRHRTQEKEIRLSGELVMTKVAWEQRGGIYHGSVREASQDSYFTVRTCELMGLPVTGNEFRDCKDFAMYKLCYAENFILEGGKSRIPCLPVFYRDKKIIKVRYRKRIKEPNKVGWSKDCESCTLYDFELLQQSEKGIYKFAGYIKE